MNEITWVKAEQVPAQPIFPGIQARTLWQTANGRKAVILEIAPGAKWEGVDVHEPGSEEAFVLSGVFNDGTRDYPAGTFIHNPIGSTHIPQSETGCTLFVFYPEG
ncbi:cupin domain-containing protein [Pseudanabaenaceae cyanobacterium LEGE 13415]|nr:cupin domain-containing protein [Pseudanabaenaceae cyanobacterium LEGE 13415]